MLYRQNLPVVHRKYPTIPGSELLTTMWLEVSFTEYLRESAP